MTDLQRPNAPLGTYGDVAEEYYRPERHPTAANFRQASRKLLERLAPEAPPRRSCEVGAGASLLAEIMWERQGDVEGLLITDISPSMLDYSREWERRGAVLRRAAASELIVADRSLLLLVASLADPYDDPRFWEEAARVLDCGGRCVLTTPSSTWADAFRAEGPARHAAEFELGDGKAVQLPSHVREPAQERELIESAGLRVVDEGAVTLAELDEPISSKIAFLDPDAPVVRAFVGERSQP